MLIFIFGVTAYRWPRHSGLAFGLRLQENVASRGTSGTSGYNISDDGPVAA